MPTNKYAAEVLEQIKRDIEGYRTAFRLIPEGKWRQGVPIGTWAHVRSYLNCRIGRLETAKLLCGWFARSVQPSYLSWEQVEWYLD